MSEIDLRKDSDSQEPIRDHWVTDVIGESNLTCPSPLQEITDDTVKSTVDRPVLRDHGDLTPRDHLRVEMVDRQYQGMEWESHNLPLSGSSNRDGRFLDWLGGSPRPTEDWRSLELGGKGAPHQCVGVERCTICCKSLCNRQSKYSCTPEDGQRLCSDVYPEAGWNQVQSFVWGGPRTMGVLLTEEDPLVGRVPPRLPERESRLGKSSSFGFQRLETERELIQADRQSVGSTGSGSFCHSSQYSTGEIRQLASGSICYGSGCLPVGVETNQSLSVSSFFHDSTVSGQVLQGKSRCGDSDTYMAEPAMVSHTVGDGCSATHTVTSVTRHASVSRWRTTSTVGPERPTVSGVESVRQQALATGVSIEAANLLAEHSWRKGTKCTYESAWRKWSSWCVSREIDPLCSPVESVINYLTDRYHQGDQYNTLNIQRSAISAFHNPIGTVRVGQHPSVTRMMSAFFNARPPMPRYESTWEVNPVLDYMMSLGDNETLALKQLTHKVAMLLALTCAGRSSDLNALDIRFMKLEDESVTFNLAKLTKSRRKGKPPLKIMLKSFPENLKLCILTTLKVCFSRTTKFRERKDGIPRSQVLLSFVEPHRAVVPCTIAGWLVKFMTEAGVDTGLFKAHSTRGAATSKAAAMGLSVKEIMSMAKWKRQATFYKHYHRLTVGGNEEKTKGFESSVLSH